MYNAQFNPYAQNVAIVKGYFKKTPVLLLAIFQFLGTMLAIVYSLFISVWSTGYTQDLMNQLSSEFSNLGVSASDLNAMTQSSLVSSIASMIPSAIIGVLVTVGYLLLFIKSRNESAESNPRAGATILFVVALIEMIGSIVAAVALLILFIIIAAAVGIGASYSSDSSAGLAAGSVIAIIAVTMVLSIFLMLFYSINKMRYFKSIKNSCSSINLYADGAGAYGVMNIISAVLALLSAGSVALLIPLSSMADDMMRQAVGSSYYDFINTDSMIGLILFSAAVMLISVVYLILEAVVAFGYKKYINKIKYSYQPANVPEAPYQPAVQPRYTAPVSYPQSQIQQPAPQQTVQQPSQPASYAPTANTAPSYCPACGSPLEADAAFCTKCGFKIK